MSQQIKFRVWDEEHKIMKPPSVNMLVDSFNGHIYWQFGFERLSPIIGTVMQFTGLKDKNGHEIYEGDLLRSKNTVIRVQWSSKDYGDSVGFGAIGLNWDTEYNIHHFCAHGEVIGNIYENADLLKP